MADDAVAFPTLDDSELAVLEALGSRRSVAVGEYLYREGDTTYDFYVILSGAAEIVVRSDGEERIITRHGPRRLSCPPVQAAERRISCHPRRRFPVLARVAPGPGVLGPQPHTP